MQYIKIIDKTTFFIDEMHFYDDIIAFRTFH